jgi:S-adenosylhomocysteine hydrolase
VKSGSQAHASEAWELLRLAVVSPEHVPLAFTNDTTVAGRLQQVWSASQGFDATATAQLRSLVGHHAKFPHLDEVEMRCIDDFIFSTAFQNRGLSRFLERHHPLPTRLPLVDELLSRYDSAGALTNTLLIACQHLLGTVTTQFDYLHRLGVAWSDMWIAGKPYSTSRVAARALANRGAHVDEQSLFPDDPLRRYRDMFERTLRSTISGALEACETTSYVRVIVLDDGGHLIRMLSGREAAFGGIPIIGVEQTTGGIEPLRVRPPSFPVIDIAASVSKVAYESEHIARSILGETDMRVKRIRGDTNLEQERVGVIGFGSVGAWVAAKLREYGRTDQIRVYDRDARKVSAARAAGFETVSTPRGMLRFASLIIGCTGQRAFDSDLDEAIRPGTILSSGSSGDMEFAGCITNTDARLLRMREEIPSEAARTSFGALHDDYESSNGHGAFWVVNGGFPVNFNGSLDPISARDIQITRALMIAGAVQATTVTTDDGLIAFAPKFDRCISETFEAFAQARHNSFG